MNKRAVVVGINKYQYPGNDLNGCVNDAEDIYDLLVYMYDFKPENIKLLTDEKATKANIIEELNWLVKESVNDDIAFYYHSSHGTQIKDVNGDEKDGLDEVLCTHDFSFDDCLTDDMLSEIFVKFGKDTSFTMMVDACHSGSADKHIFTKEEKQPHKIKYIPHPYLVPDIAMKKKRIGRCSKYVNKHLLISGCQDNQTSAEAIIGGKSRGAMTYFLTTLLKEGYNTKAVNVLRDVLLNTLKGNGYTQRPNFDGMKEVLNNTFLG